MNYERSSRITRQGKIHHTGLFSCYSGIYARPFYARFFFLLPFFFFSFSLNFLPPSLILFGCNSFISGFSFFFLSFKATYCRSLVEPTVGTPCYSRPTYCSVCLFFFHLSFSMADRLMANGISAHVSPVDVARQLSLKSQQYIAKSSDGG